MFTGIQQYNKYEWDHFSVKKKCMKSNIKPEKYNFQQQKVIISDIFQSFCLYFFLEK